MVGYSKKEFAKKWKMKGSEFSASDSAGQGDVSVEQCGSFCMMRAEQGVFIQAYNRWFDSFLDRLKSLWLESKAVSLWFVEFIIGCFGEFIGHLTDLT